jgi:hypothetical protein
MITQEYLKSILSYDPETGIFIWKEVNSHRIRVGDVAGSRHLAGYLTIRINSKSYLCHRLAWLYMNGVFPEKQIDHINGNRTDNIFCNLREANNSENSQNKKKHQSNNNQKLLGCCYHKAMGKYHCQLNLNGKKVVSSFHDTASDAHQAYIEAKRKYHKFNTI